MRTIKATVYKCDNTKQQILIDKKKSLEILQGLVGGYIEIINLVKIYDQLQGNFSGSNDLVINEEGRLFELPINPWTKTIAKGTFWENEDFRGDIVLIEGKLP